MGRFLYRGASRWSACHTKKHDARLQRQGKTEFAPCNVPGECMRRWSYVLICILVGVALAGCPKNGNKDYKAGQKAVDLKDYDAAVEYYGKALASDPHNAFYRIKLNEARFEAGGLHVRQGLKLREKGDLQGAISEFQRAQVLDPSSIIADQELKKTLDMLADQVRANEQQGEQPLVENGQPALASAPPELKPLSRAPINIKMSNDAKMDFNNVTLEQALDITCLESKTFWKPITENIIIVVPDQAQKRRDYDEQVVRTFYLSNVAIAQDLTEITTGLRQLLDLKRIQQVNSQNAIIIRDTPDKLMLADKIIRDIDKAKPEVIVQVMILEARTDNLRNLGIVPGQSASVAINPSYTSSTSTSSTTTTTTSSGANTAALNQLRHLNQSDLVFTLPSATANFLLTDSSTKILQNPELRGVDGQSAKLKIGDRVPVATGSFQAGVGVGATSGAGFVNPLVNTQFQYIDVGVNVDVTPHVHPNRDISMKVSIEVSSVTGTSTIGGISQPIISQRKVEHEIRLKEGEVSILGGLIQRTDTKTLNGWPGLANVPAMRYLFSAKNTEIQEDEVLIVLVPRVVRMPDWNKANLRAMFSGTDTFVGAKRELEVKAPTANPNPQMIPPAGPAQTPAGPLVPAGAPAPAPAPVTQPVAPGVVPQAQGTMGPRMRFEPAALNLTAGQTATIGVVVENVTDLYSVPMLLQYNPAIISV